MKVVIIEEVYDEGDFVETFYEIYIAERPLSNPLKAFETLEQAFEFCDENRYEVVTNIEELI